MFIPELCAQDLPPDYEKDKEEIAICPNCIKLVSHVHSRGVARVKSSQFTSYRPEQMLSEG
jgi:hypothetical protein